VSIRTRALAAIERNPDIDAETLAAEVWPKFTRGRFRQNAIDAARVFLDSLRREQLEPEGGM